MKKNNYEIQCEKTVAEVVNLDHMRIADRFNLEYDDDYLYLNYIGYKYRVGRNKAVIERINEDMTYKNAEFNEVMSILDLFEYSKDTPEAALFLTGNFVTPHGLKGTISGGNTNKHSDLFYRYAKKFSSDIDGMMKACEKLGGKKVNTGDVGYIINIFKDISIMIVFYDKDCDFDEELKFFWDENILSFVHYETTFYIAHNVFDNICEIMDK